MNGKIAKKIRKEFNALERKFSKSKNDIADELVRELLDAPLKYRFKFAMRIIFGRRH